RPVRGSCIATRCSSEATLFPCWLWRRTNRDRPRNIAANGNTARCRNRLPLETLPLRRKHDIKQPLPDRQQAGAHLVGLIRGNLGKGVVDPVDETLGARFVDLELRLKLAFDVKRPQRDICPTRSAAALSFGMAASQT